ncbi:hypothetical protein [Flavobacterium sp. 3HN19-14]|uniref:hypothetical protein n=1 Tax=Flavobacterium sp. 3HN19-14 TaxID=3448133 RepID=UPI003EE3ED57
MNWRAFWPVFQAVAISIILYGIHKLIFGFLLPETEDTYHFSLLELYGFFGIGAVMVTSVSVILRKHSINNVGQVFMLTTMLQILGCFAFFYSPINAEAIVPTEKSNFIIIFLLFLAMETILTIRLLNKNQ